MVEISAQLMRAVLDTAPEGVIVCAVRPPVHPILYANGAFGRLIGHAPEELIGQDLCRLPGVGSTLDAVGLQLALARTEVSRVQLHPLRQDGTQPWLELQLQPLPASADATERHLLGLLRALSEPEQPPASAALPAVGLASWLREDRLSGLSSRAFFEQLLQRDWQIGLREGRPLTMLAFDIDELAGYNETYGRAAGDACIRRVAGVIGASFRRGSDLVARWQGGLIVALVRNSDPATMPAFASAVAQKVLDQHIHHPRARRQKFIAVSVGAVSVVPSARQSPDRLVQAALRALKKAKQDRQQRIAVAGPGEID